jgi:Phosphatidylinositol transfer protein
MIARHSSEQSHGGDGVEVVVNRECTEDEENMDDNQKYFLKEREDRSKGQFTEKRIHLSSRLPYWLQAVTPRVFYVCEKSWNFYPFTITEYTCSFLPKFRVEIYTKFEDNNGSTENTFHVPEDEYNQLTIDSIDIAFDELTKHYKEEEDPRYFKSLKTGRGPLTEGWRITDKPMMCSYKLVHASFEVWGFQTKTEEFIHRCIRDVLLLGHRQAFTWIDQWFEMDMEAVREYERKLQEETNQKVLAEVTDGVEDEFVDAKDDLEID